MAGRQTIVVALATFSGLSPPATITGMPCARQPCDSDAADVAQAQARHLSAPMPGRQWPRPSRSFAQCLQKPCRPGGPQRRERETHGPPGGAAALCVWCLCIAQCTEASDCARSFRAGRTLVSRTVRHPAPHTRPHAHTPLNQRLTWGSGWNVHA